MVIIIGYTFWYDFAGSFVVVDDSGRVEAVESGSKVACVVLQVLFHDQVRVLQKSSEWLVSISSYQLTLSFLRLEAIDNLP